MYSTFHKSTCSKDKRDIEVLCPRKVHVYSNKKETSDFHGTVSFDPVKMLQQK